MFLFELEISHCKQPVHRSAGTDENSERIRDMHVSSTGDAGLIESHRAERHLRSGDRPYMQYISCTHACSRKFDGIPCRLPFLNTSHALANLDPEWHPHATLNDPITHEGEVNRRIA
ncbi:MAG: hypothetical protein ACYCZE_01405 [Thiobacillus sp.]